MNCDHIDHAYSLKPPSDDDVRKLLFDLGHFHVADEKCGASARCT